MRSLYRCKENYQGDRCKLEKSHTGNHESNNASWDETSTKQKHTFTPRSEIRRFNGFLTGVKNGFITIKNFKNFLHLFGDKKNESA